ncbi:hypothetical protein BDV95DRAFT_594931 [Massariosphaeria phaeospora]|uniref:VOC domain-containing protein n=1 Tax=Massariosphaeria phaeospora TaxID=100035 RepID=A0A7C8M7Q5_9PLEO|nr:hypothetical protein BDV95DRAFT_594931 [Massariosphaeria phaeospora]
MPVSHIGLTVSHLPTSCSFFLAALQPLGYRFIGQQGNQIGLGIHDADFFLCQETPGVKAGAAHIAFTAPSRTAVRDFYTAALNAGGRPNGAPASRSEEIGHFNAAILDLDGNSIEVVFSNGPDLRDDGTVIEHSRVITWQRTVAESYRDDRSVVSSRTAQSASKQALVPAAPASRAPSIASRAPSVASKASMSRSVSAPVAVPQVAPPPSATGDGAAKKIIGTLIGAAAGAAVAYAMCKSEQDSAKKETDFNAFMKAKAAASHVVHAAAQAIDQPKPSLQDPQQMIDDAPPRSIHRYITDGASQYSSSPQERSVYAQRAIEPAPPSYHSPTYTSVPPTQIVDQRAIEYVPAYSIAPSRSQFTAQRSVTSPELLTVAKARSSASRAQSVARSAAPSSLISSFVPDPTPTLTPRRESEGSIHSHHSSRSHKDKAKSHVSHLSKHSSHSRHSSSKSRSRGPSPPPPATATASRAQSLVGSILGRDSQKSTAASRKDDVDDDDDDDLIGDLDIEHINDSDTVAPSDSISNAGSSSRRSHRSSHRRRRSSSRGDGGGSVASSKHSSSGRSSASKHSHRSAKKSHHQHHHSSSSRSSGASALSREWFNADDGNGNANNDKVPPPASRVHSVVVSEPSDASTVRPARSSRAGGSSRVSSRKDSLTDKVDYGPADGAPLPIRGITQSMVDGGGGDADAKSKNQSQSQSQRSMMSYAMGQRLRPFE